jgi:hypothetical protein
MKGSGSNVVSAIHNLKLAQLHFEDFCRQYRNSIGEKKFKIYISKIDWIFKDIITTNVITDEVRVGIKNEINSDVLLVPELHRKMALLEPDQRDLLEEVIDLVLAGETIEVLSNK